MAHEVDADSYAGRKRELRMENGEPVSDNPCPVCGDSYVHETEPPQNRSSVSGMHVCYDVQGSQLVMYIHGERQSIYADDEGESFCPHGDTDE